MFRRGQLERELSDELQFHLEHLVQQNLASGLNLADARASALRDLGNLDGWKEECRDQRGLNLLDNLWRDSRYALRMTAANRVLSAVIILSLSFGVAGTSAIFSMVYAVVIDPFPYTDARNISLITFSAPGIHRSPLLFPVADYPAISRLGGLRESFAFKRVSSIASRDPVEPVARVEFSPTAFGFLGVPMWKGRAFASFDETNVAVLSYAFWKRRYAGADVLGQTLQLDREPFTIIGVAPPRFQWANGDVYAPLRPRAGGGPEINVVARPGKGISLSALSLEIDALTHRLAETDQALYPRGKFRMRAVSLTDHMLGNTRRILIVLSAASAFLLLIACANVSILLFARAGARQREMAVRIAMGATTGRILAQMLVEAVVLSLAGGVLGLLLASTALRILLLLMPANALPSELTFEINPTVVLATFATCVFTAILFGLLPAFEAATMSLSPSMKDGGMSIAGNVTGSRSRGLLIMAEVSLTILLMAGTGVTVRTLVALHSVQLGYDPSNVIKIGVPLPEGEYGTWSARAAVFDRLLTGLGSIPGVRLAAATGDAVPPNIGFPASFDVEGQPQSLSRSLQIALVGGDYFER